MGGQVGQPDRDGLADQQTEHAVAARQVTDIGGGGLVVGRSGAEPVAHDYAGESPWPFVGGTIKRVVIDVSGESFVDLAAEARAAFARQ